MEENEYCSRCGKNTKIYIDNYRPMVAINQKKYQEAIDNRMGLYCAVCHRNFCLDCIRFYTSADKIENETIKTAMVEYAKKIPANEKMKYFLLSCPLCNTNLGDLHSSDQEVLLKALDEKEVDLDDLSESMKNLFVLQKRLKAKNLVADRSKTLGDMLHSLCE